MNINNYHYGKTSVRPQNEYEQALYNAITPPGIAFFNTTATAQDLQAVSIAKSSYPDAAYLMGLVPPGAFIIIVGYLFESAVSRIHLPWFTDWWQQQISMGNILTLTEKDGKMDLVTRTMGSTEMKKVDWRPLLAGKTVKQLLGAREDAKKTIYYITTWTTINPNKPEVELIYDMVGDLDLPDWPANRIATTNGTLTPEYTNMLRSALIQAINRKVNGGLGRGGVDKTVTLNYGNLKTGDLETVTKPMTKKEYKAMKAKEVTPVSNSRRLPSVITDNMIDLRSARGIGRLAGSN